MQKHIKAFFVSERLSTKLIRICEYNKCDYVNFDSLTIKELAYFIVNGILFHGVVRIYPIYSCFLALCNVLSYLFASFLKVLSHLLKGCYMQREDDLAQMKARMGPEIRLELGEILYESLLHAFKGRY